MANVARHTTPEVYTMVSFDVLQHPWCTSDLKVEGFLDCLLQDHAKATLVFNNVVLARTYLKVIFNDQGRPLNTEHRMSMLRFQIPLSFDQFARAVKIENNISMEVWEDKINAIGAETNDPSSLVERVQQIESPSAVANCILS